MKLQEYFCVQRKQTILSVFEILPSGKKIFWRMLVTKQLLAAIDFYSIFFQTMQVNGYQQLFYYQDSSQYFLFCSTEEWNVFRLGTEPTHRRQILYTPMKYLHTVLWKTSQRLRQRLILLQGVSKSCWREKEKEGGAERKPSALPT